MKRTHRISLALCLGLVCSAFAQDAENPLSPTEKQPAAPVTAAPKPEPTPSVEAAIPKASLLGEDPAPFPGNGVRMAITATSDEVQEMVLLGLNHLHAGWEFEASRCFARAMRADPDCLLAHWGMAMTLLTPSPETTAAREAVLIRLLSLVERGLGTELERGYAYALMKFAGDGPAAGASAFHKVSEHFPNDPQAAIFAALFGRGGFDANGQATPDQQAAEDALRKLAALSPTSPLPLHALLFIRSEGPNPQESLADASKLCQLAPDYPPYVHLLGHYQWRSGQHRAAATSFSRAAELYQDWMTRQKLTFADCPEFLKAGSYRVTALSSLGDSAAALAAAQKLAATAIPESRPDSPGARFLVWEIKSLPARLLLRAPEGNFSASIAAASLPSTQETRNLRNHTLAYWWLDGLRMVIETRRLLDAGNSSEAMETLSVLIQHTAEMAKTRPKANLSGERSHWSRAQRALESLASEIRGRIARACKSSTAYNWFAAAADRQQQESLAMPPIVLTPMATLLGDELMTSQKPADAIETYQHALELFPNDHRTLRQLQAAYTANQQPEKAAEIERQLQSQIADP